MIVSSCLLAIGMKGAFMCSKLALLAVVLITQLPCLQFSGCRLAVVLITQLQFSIVAGLQLCLLPCLQFSILLQLCLLQACSCAYSCLQLSFILRNSPYTEIVLTQHDSFIIDFLTHFSFKKSGLCVCLEITKTNSYCLSAYVSATKSILLSYQDNLSCMSRVISKIALLVQYFSQARKVNPSFFISLIFSFLFSSLFCS